MPTLLPKLSDIFIILYQLDNNSFEKRLSIIQYLAKHL